jgi:hypothetical protein
LAASGLLTAKNNHSGTRLFCVHSCICLPLETKSGPKPGAANQRSNPWLPGKNSGLVEAHAGINLAVSRKDYEFGGVMKFVDKEALDAYQVHPLHKQLLGWLVPLIDAVELDFEA